MPTSDTDNTAHLNGAAYAAYITVPLGGEVWSDEGIDDRHNGANHSAAADGAPEPVEPVPSRPERRRRQRAEGGFDTAEDLPKELSDFDRAVLIQRFVDQNVIENTDNFWTETSNARLQKLGPFPRVTGETLVIRIHRPDGTHSYQLRPRVPRGAAKYLMMKGSGGDVHVAAASIEHLKRSPRAAGLHRIAHQGRGACARLVMWNRALRHWLLRRIWMARPQQ